MVKCYGTLYVLPIFLVLKFVANKSDEINQNHRNIALLGVGLILHLATKEFIFFEACSLHLLKHGSTFMFVIIYICLVGLFMKQSITTV